MKRTKLVILGLVLVASLSIVGAVFAEVVIPTVTNSPASNVTSSTAIVYGEITDLGTENCTYRGFGWGTVAGVYANSEITSGDYGLGSFDCTLTDLPENTTIYWRAMAKNSAGWGYSSGLSFDTTRDTSGAGFLSIFLICIALGLTFVSLFRRNIVFSIAASLGWLSLGLILVTDPELINITSLEEGWVTVLAYLFFMMSAGCLLHYISGIGKTKITMTDIKGRSWQMWGKPPTEVSPSRSNLAKDRHKERLKARRPK